MPPVDLEFLLLGMFGQFQQKFSLFLQELKQLNVVVPDIELGCSWNGLGGVTNLLDEGIDSLTGLDGNILVLLLQEVIKLVKQVYIVFG